MRTILNGLRSLLSPTVPARSRPAPACQPRRFRPRLDELEGRLAPAGLVWQNPWQITLGYDPWDGDPSGYSHAAFGDAGAAGDEGPGTATASALAYVYGASGGTANPDAPQYGSSEGYVAFQRTFQLSGSPRGWIVGLDGLLSGVLRGEAYNSSAWASVGARIQIVQGTSGSVTHDLDFGEYYGSAGWPNGHFRVDVWAPGWLERVVPDGTYTVTGSMTARASWSAMNADWPEAASEFFDPPGLVATIDAIPSDRPPVLSVRDATFVEGNTGTATRYFTVALSYPIDQTVTVDFALADGSATLGDNDYGYLYANRTVTFAPGVTEQTIAMQIHGDRTPEPNQTFVVTLGSPTNATIADGQGVGTIVDDEPRISISDVSKKEGKKGQTTLFTFTVTLSAAYDQAVTMSFATANGTAQTSDNDYIARTGMLTFAAGETTKTITIEVKGDSKNEASETFYLDLFGLSGNALFTKNRGIGTILNDD